MSRRLATLSLTLALTVLIPAAGLHAGTVKADWCSLTAPDSAQVGQTITVTIDYRDVPAGQTLYCDLHWNKGPNFGGINSVGKGARAVSGSGSHSFTFKVADKSGMTSVRAVAFISPGGYAELTKKVQSELIPVGGSKAAATAPSTPALPAASNPVQIDVDLAAAPRPAIVETMGMTLKLIDYIDCTDPDDPHEMLDMGTSKVVDGPAGRYRITAPHNHALFSYRYKTAGKDRPVLLVVEYPDDADRIMNFMTHDATRPAREHTSFSTESGVYTGMAYPLSGAMRYFTQVVWPQDNLSPLIVVNVNREPAPAAASRIWVYAIEAMPAAPIDAPAADDQRQLDMFFPLLFLAQRDNFGWKSPRSMEHLADYCNYIGVNRVTAMVYANQGWGAMCTVKAWDADDGGNLENILKTFEAKDVGFIFGIVADGMYGVTTAGGKKIAEMAPAEAEKVLKAGFREIVERYGKYKSFKGIALSSMEAFGFTKMLIDKDLLGEMVDYIHSLRPDLEVLTFAGNAYLQSPHLLGKPRIAETSHSPWTFLTGWESGGGNWTENLGEVILDNWKNWDKHPAQLAKLAPALHVYEQREPDDFALVGAYRHVAREGMYFDMARADLGDAIDTPYAAIFGTFMEAWLGLKRDVNFWDNKLWTAPDYNPAGPLGRAAWANALANDDRLAISAGSWTVKYFGLDPWMRPFAEALRSLPPVVMTTVEATEDARVVVRYVEYRAKRYVYAVSRIPFAQEIVVDGRSRTLEPFALAAWSDGGSGSPSVTLKDNADYRAWLEARFDAFERLCAETADLDRAAVPAACDRALRAARDLLADGKPYRAELTCTYGMAEEIALRKSILAPTALQVQRVGGTPTASSMPAAAGPFGGANLQDHVYYPTTWGGLDDLSATVSFAHDGENLYVLARVRDSVANEKDGISIRFSRENWRKWQDDGQRFDGPMISLKSGQVATAPLRSLGVRPGESCGFLITVGDVDDEHNHPEKHSWAIKQALLIPLEPGFAPWSDARVCGELKFQE